MSRKTLFGRTALIISVTMLAFALAAVAIVGQFIVKPIGKRNVEDLSALILLSAQTYVELPPETRADFVDELSSTHQLFWGTGEEKLSTKPLSHPRFHFMQQVLSERLGENVELARQMDDHHRYWIDLHMAGEGLRIGFHQKRLGEALPYVALYLSAILLLTTLLGSLILVRKLTRPIKDLSVAAKIVGSGNTPKPLAEDGPKELAETARAFNKMSTDVQALLENRTVLLSGISHDLRTPLTRLNLALEMLPDNVDDELRNELKEAIGNMELIIAEYMQLAKGLEQDSLKTTHIQSLIGDIVSELNQDKNQLIQLTGDDACQINTYTEALHRVLFNLIENAIRYGEGAPIEISWQCDQNVQMIRIKDQGPGIPEQHRSAIFRPFYRLERSRNRNSGGSGLGLAIVEQLVNQRGWKIAIDDAPEGGTQVTLSL